MSNTISREGAEAQRQEDIAVCKVGDFVTWTHAKTGLRLISYSTRRGTVTGIRGTMAIIKMRNGRVAWVPYSGITRADQKSAITKLFEGIAKAIVDGTLKVDNSK